MWTWSSLAGVLAVVTPLGCARNDAERASRRGEPLQPLHVAAAADLSGAFAEIGAAFEKETGQNVSFTFGSTGLLARQIKGGAPFDVFAAANVSFVEQVVASGDCFGETKRRYAQGRLVLWARDEAHLPKSLAELRDPKYGTIAMANPEHAPYGKAAREALEKAGLWADAQPRTVFGENVQQAFLFAQSGNADVAIVALSVAVGAKGAYLPIDGALHEPLEQAIVACKAGASGGRPKEARAFLDFVGSATGRSIMQRYGFSIPGQPPMGGAGGK